MSTVVASEAAGWRAGEAIIAIEIALNECGIDADLLAGEDRVAFKEILLRLSIATETNLAGECDGTQEYENA